MNLWRQFMNWFGFSSEEQHIDFHEDIKNELSDIRQENLIQNQRLDVIEAQLNTEVSAAIHRG